MFANLCRLYPILQIWLYAVIGKLIHTQLVNVCLLATGKFSTKSGVTISVGSENELTSLSQRAT